MSRLVWEVRAIGGDPFAVRDAVRGAVETLHEGVADSVDDETREAWTHVLAANVVDVATGDGATSVLVEVETSAGANEYTPGLLSGGFDDVVLDAVLDVEGVTEAAHSDRMERKG